MKTHTYPSIAAKFSVVIFVTALALPTASFAEAIQLNSFDGSMSMTGELVAYQDGNYQLGTSLGVLRVSAKLVLNLSKFCWICKA